jgi:hypothetical protein
MGDPKYSVREIVKGQLMLKSIAQIEALPKSLEIVRNVASGKGIGTNRGKILFPTRGEHDNRLPRYSSRNPIFGSKRGFGAKQVYRAIEGSKC